MQGKDPATRRSPASPNPRPGSSSGKEITPSRDKAELQSSVATQVNHLAAQLQLVITRLEDLASPKPATAAADQPPTPSAHIFNHAASCPPSPTRKVLRGFRMFDHSSPAGEASRVLLGLRQGARRVVDYAIEFRTLAAGSGWNSPAIKDAFVHDLNESIKDQLVPPETLRDFEDVVDLRLQERQADHRRTGRKSSEPPGGAQSTDPHCCVFAKRQPQSQGAEMPELDHSDYPDLSRVPPCYHDLREVFNKTKATSLPPHRPWDCTIPKARLYAISSPERKAMDDYIEASLKSGIICPLSSPAGAGFFFVGKKDSSLRPCIDYSALNDHHQEPLPSTPHFIGF
ncbi:hypothetical protein L3Q82_003447 [Scortum barcoo]|uniref:Uncharacterized protein n=1 Tax=Scortum barcoo TaxID=214431 RepID=A0ACB8VMZ8_9TELE|nr:hypothetical protein L3Q82_003447 [Scortum barcoo]